MPTAGICWEARRAGAWLALVAALGTTPGGAVRAEDRVALLIGNSHYANTQLDLRNPANDARALAEALDNLGFEVSALIDADRAETEAAVAEFAREAEEAEIALFFFAGHGVQIGGANYLLSSGFSTLDPEGVAGEALSLDTLRAALGRARPELGLIVLDACRNNPFAQGGLAPRGLARVRAQGGSGLLIVYATDPGNVAYDGLDANSLFTSALIDHIATPGLEVRLMFGRVRQDAVLASSGRQVPWVEESVLGEHFLNPAPAEAEPGEASAVEQEVELWRVATTEGSAQAYRDYLKTYPAGLFQALATERLERLEEAPAAAGTAPVPPGASRDDLAAALATLGLLSQARSAQPGEVDAAYARYARQTGGASDPDALYLDAAQFAVLVGAATAQLIRTDLGALAAHPDRAGRGRAGAGRAARARRRRLRRGARRARGRRRGHGGDAAGPRAGAGTARPAAGQLCRADRLQPALPALPGAVASRPARPDARPCDRGGPHGGGCRAVRGACDRRRGGADRGELRMAGGFPASGLIAALLGGAHRRDADDREHAGTGAVKTTDPARPKGELSMTGRFAALKLATVVSAALLAGCVEGGPGAGAGASGPEAELARQAQAMQRTVLEGAATGALLGGVGTALFGGDREDVLKGALIGGVAGAAAGTYVGHLQQQYASDEDRLERLRADIERTNAETEAAVRNMRTGAGAEPPAARRGPGRRPRRGPAGRRSGGRARPRQHAAGDGGGGAAARGVPVDPLARAGRGPGDRGRRQIGDLSRRIAEMRSITDTLAGEI